MFQYWVNWSAFLPSWIHRGLELTGSLLPKERSFVNDAHVFVTTATYPYSVIFTSTESTYCPSLVLDPDSLAQGSEEKHTLLLILVFHLQWKSRHARLALQQYTVYTAKCTLCSMWNVYGHVTWMCLHLSVSSMTTVSFYVRMLQQSFFAKDRFYLWILLCLCFKASLANES